MTRLFECLVVLALFCAACSSDAPKKEKTSQKATEHTSGETGTPSVSNEGMSTIAAGPNGLLYASVRTSASKVPRRFSAELPSSEAELQSDQTTYPDQFQIQYRICAGEKGAFDLWKRALRRALGKGELDGRMRQYLLNLVSCYKEVPELCAGLVKEIRKSGGKEREFLVSSLEDCQGVEAKKAIDDPRTPAPVIVGWYFQQAFRTYDKISSEFKRAAEKTASSSRGRELRTLGVTLAIFNDPHMADWVATLGHEKGSESFAWLTIGLSRHPDKEARELAEQACAHPEVMGDSMCDRLVEDKSGPKDESRTLVEEVRNEDIWGREFDPRKWQSKTGAKRNQVIAELSDCVAGRDLEAGLRRHCLGALARFDRPSASVAASKTMKDSEAPYYLQEAARILVAFPKDADLYAKLRDLGLLSADANLAKLAEAEGMQVPIMPVDILALGGRVLCFDVETDTFPNSHDVLMLELAALLGEEMKEFRFEEIPPKATETEDGFITDGPYVLRAYAHGKVHETTTEVLDDWYDVGAVLGFLNAVLRANKSDYRFMAVDTNGQMMCVAAGPKEGLVNAEKAGILNNVSSNRSMETGRAAEDSFLQEMNEQGAEVKRNVLLPHGH